MYVIQSNNAWDIVAKPPTTNIVGYRWFYRHKFENNGRLDRYKGRLVGVSKTKLKNLKPKKMKPKN